MARTDTVECDGCGEEFERSVFDNRFSVGERQDDLCQECREERYGGLVQ